MKTIYFLAALGLFALAGCSSNTVKDTLGLDRSVPDEFRVVSRPPLSMPPDFTLHPPTTDDVSPNQKTATQQAQSLLQGNASKATSQKTGDSSAESQFLKRAGANNADPKIRESLVEEKITAQDQEESHSWWDIFSSDDAPKKDPIVNAKDEASRIQKNADEGKPVTEGDTPEVKPTDRGILGKILGD